LRNAGCAVDCRRLAQLRNVQCLMPGPFTQTNPQLLPILHELLPLEPIFHTKDFGLTRPDFEKRMVQDYWEIGASGRRYSREFILELLLKNPPVNATSAGWQTSDHAVRQLGPDVYLLTYTLRQGERLTRRSTVWQKTSEGWCVLYHQGTIATSESSSE